LGFFDPQLFVLKIRLFIGCFFCWFVHWKIDFRWNFFFFFLLKTIDCPALPWFAGQKNKNKTKQKNETFWENLFCSCLQNIDDLGASIRKCSSRLFCQKNKEKTFLDKLLAIVPILQIISDHQKTVLIFFKFLHCIYLAQYFKCYFGFRYKKTLVN